MTRGEIRCQVGDFTLESQWEVSPVQVLVLFGPSGSGKTTILRAIAGLVSPIGGHIEVGDQVVYDRDTQTWVPPYQRKVGYVTQQYHLFPHLSVSRNISYGIPRGNSKRKFRDDGDRIAHLLDAFHLDGLANRRTWELSDGQQQRVALARALATEPQVLLLDEPFSSLDTELRRILRREIRAVLSNANIPVILVTHDREDALAVGDAVQVIDQGRTLERGEPLRVLGQPGQGRLARLVGLENTLAMRVESRHPQDGTMVCVGIDSSSNAGAPSPGSSNPETSSHDTTLRLEVPLSDFDEGQAVTVGIRSSDIILAAERLTSSSARNQIKGQVTMVELRPPGYEVTLECLGVPIRCHITGRSLSEMNITPGTELWAVFKASSCFLVGDETG